MEQGIPAGYKQTEVGVIPEDWDTARLADHFSIYAGGDVSKGRLSPIRTAEYSVPIYANATQNAGLYGYTDKPRSKADSVTVTARGYLGHAEYRREPFFPIVRLLVLEPTGGLDARYTAYFINNRLSFAIESTGVPQLTAPQIAKYVMAAPAEVAEQRAIADALGDVDALLDALDRLIAKQRDLKQAAMQQLLTGRTRLPGFTGEWVGTRLGQIGVCLRGVTYNPDIDLEPFDTSYTLRLLRANNIQHADLLMDDLQFVRIGRVSDTQRLVVGDIVICMANGSRTLVGKSAVFDCADGHAYTFGAFMGCFRVDPKSVDASFVGYLFQTHRYRAYLHDLLAGSTINNLAPQAIESLVFAFPPIAEQTAIAAVLSDLDAEIAALEARRAKTRDLKQAMLQELLTGRTRLV